MGEFHAILSVFRVMTSPVIPTSFFFVMWYCAQTHRCFLHFISSHLGWNNCFSLLLLSRICPTAGDVSFKTLQQELKLPAEQLPGIQQVSTNPVPSSSILQDFSKKLNKYGHLHVFISFAHCLEQLLHCGAEDGPCRTQFCSVLSEILQDEAGEPQAEALSQNRWITE